MAIKLVSAYARIIGTKFLKEVLSPLVAGICENPENYEIDPNRADPKADLKKNSERLRSITQFIFTKIVKEADRFPVGIKKICYLFKIMVQERFTDFWYTAVGGFVFLRFVCPALVSPKGFDIYDGNKLLISH
jgi:neurofibromin 1